MPRIPIIEQTTSASMGSSMARASAAPIQDAMGQGLRSAAQGVGNYIDAVDRQDQQDAKAWTSSALPDVTLKAQDLLQKQKESSKEAAAGFTPTYLEQFDKLTSATLENAPNKHAKQYLQEHFDHMRTQYGSQAMGFEANARTSWRTSKSEKAADEWAILVGRGDTNYEFALKSYEQTLPDVGPEYRTKLLDSFKSKVTNAIGATAVANNPEAVLKSVNHLLNTQSRSPGSSGSGSSTPVDAKTIANAIYGQESGGGTADTSKVNSQNVTGPMQIMSSTFEGMKKLNIIPQDYDWKNPQQNKEAGFKWVEYLTKKYAGNPDKVAAAYYAGEKAVNSDGTINRDWKNKERPGDPTVGQYIDQVKAKIGGSTKVAMSSTGTATDAQTVAEGPAVNVPPWMKDMNVNQLMQLRQHADSQAQHVSQQAQTSLRLATQNAEAMAQSGTAPTDPPKSITDFQAAYRDPVAAEVEYQRYATARQSATQIASYKTQSSQELVGLLEGNKAQKLFGGTDPNDPAFAVKERGRQIVEGAAAQVVKARQEDPWGYAIQNNDFGAQILDPSKPDFSDQLKVRAAALPGMMQKYGSNAVLLSKPEASMLSKQISAMPAEQRVQMLAEMRSSVGDERVYSNLMNSIRADSPVTAMVGNIASLGGAIKLGDQSVSKSEVARRISIGEDLLNKTKDAKSTDGSRSGFPMPKEDHMRQAWVDAVGSAYAGYPEAEAHAYQAYRAYYASQAAAKGLNDPKAGMDDKIATEAITASTGGVAKWGGSWYGGGDKLILPYGMSNVDFKDRVSGEWKKLATQNGYSKTTVDEIGLKPTGQNGVYFVMSGTSWLPGKDGRKLTINTVGVKK